MKLLEFLFVVILVQTTFHKFLSAQCFVTLYIARRFQIDENNIRS